MDWLRSTALTKFDIRAWCSFFDILNFCIWSKSSSIFVVSCYGFSSPFHIVTFKFSIVSAILDYNILDHFFSSLDHRCFELFSQIWLLTPLMNINSNPLIRTRTSNVWTRKLQKRPNIKRSGLVSGKNAFRTTFDGSRKTATNLF